MTDQAVEALPPRIAVDDKGHYWRDYLDHYSMPPVSEGNEPVEVVAYYLRLEGKPAARSDLRAALERIIKAWDAPAFGKTMLEKQLDRMASTGEAIDAARAALAEPPTGGTDHE